MTKEFHSIESFRSPEAKRVTVDNRCPYVPYARERYDEAVKYLLKDANTRDVTGKPAIRIAENIKNIEKENIITQARTTKLRSNLR